MVCGEGVLYPSLLGVQQQMYAAAGINPFSIEELTAAVPAVQNVALVFTGYVLCMSRFVHADINSCCTGNSALYPAASTLPNKKPSNLLKQDLIQLGNFGLFDGPSDTKQWICIMLPFGLLLYFSSLFYCLKAYTELSASELCEYISPKSFSGAHKWALEKLPRKRLLKKTILFSCYLLTTGTLASSLYIAKRLSVDTNLSCFIWKLDATSLAPYQGLDEGSEAFYWLFTLSAVLLNIGFLHHLIETRDENQEWESRVVLATFRRIFMQCNTTGNNRLTKIKKVRWAASCVENWQEQVNWKKRRDVWHPCKWMVFYVLNTLLHLSIIALLSIPGFMYLIAKSVGSYGVLKAFSNSTVVSISGIILRTPLYWVATMLAGFRQQFYEDEVINRKSLPLSGIKFNQWRTTSMFIITWTVDIVVPIACIIIFDESCLRQYLGFSPSISGIMNYWSIGETGFDAYRRGFCLQKLINVFSPVWCTTACLSVFISPATKLWKSSPAYQSAVEWLSQWWNQRCSSGDSETSMDAKKESSSIPQETVSVSQQAEETAMPGDEELDQIVQQQVEELEARIMEQSVDIAQFLSQVATASAFGLLVPALCFYVALTIPAWLLAIDCIALMESSKHDGAHQSIQRMLVSYPRSGAWCMFVLSAWIVIHFLLFDFGFPLGCWVLFELSCVCVVLGVVLLKPKRLRAKHAHTILFNAAPSCEQVIEFRSESSWQRPRS